MRAITLTQPWAGLVASGIKRIENRSRSIIRREDFGKPFAVHASKVIDDDVYARIAEIAPGLRSDFHYREFARRGGGNYTRVRSTPHAHRWMLLSRITSAVIAVATIERAVVEWRDGSVVDAHGRDGMPVVDLGDQRRWFFGRVGYVLRDVIALPKPVPCRGRQGFWTMPDDLARQVEEQIR